MADMELFRTRDEILSEAYERHGEDIAYQDDTMRIKEHQEEDLP